MSGSGKLSVGWLYDDSLDSNDGVAQYVKTIGAWLSDNGHDVAYLVGESKLRLWHGAPVYSLSSNIKVRWSGNRMTIPLRPKLKQIRSLVNERQFDVVHVMAPYSPLMAKQVINRLPDSVGLVATWHIFPSNRQSALASRLLKPAYGASLKRFDQSISVSPAAQAYTRASFRIDSLVIPNAVKLPSIKTSRSSKRRIVFLGRLVERKGAQYLVKAFAELAKTEANIELIIAGRGPGEAKLQQLVNQLGVEHIVSFTGFVSEQDKPALLASADIACFPSLYGESFGVVLIEAMAAGAGVVVGGDNPGYRSVLGEQSELLIDPKNTAIFAGRLASLLNDQTLATRLHEWQQSELTKYDVETVGPQILKVYHQAIAKRQTSGHN